MNSDVLWQIFALSNKKHWRQLCFLESNIWYSSEYNKWRSLILVSTYPFGKILRDFGNEELFLWLDARKTITVATICMIYNFRKESVIYDLLRSQIPSKVYREFRKDTRFGCVALIRWLNEKIDSGSLERHWGRRLYRAHTLHDHLRVFEWITEKLGLHTGEIVDGECWIIRVIAMQGKIDTFGQLGDLFAYEQSKSSERLC